MTKVMPTLILIAIVIKFTELLFHFKYLLSVILIPIVYF